MSHLGHGSHGPVKFNLAPYKPQNPDSDQFGRRSLTINELRSVLPVVTAIGYHVIGMFVTAPGMNLPTLNEQQLLDSGADPDKDRFGLIYETTETQRDVSPGTDVGISGTGFSGAELWCMIHGCGDGSPHDPIQVIKNLILWHYPSARGGEGTGALKLDAAEPQARVVDISAAAEAQFVRFLSGDAEIAARARQILGMDPTAPADNTGPINPLAVKDHGKQHES